MKKFCVPFIIFGLIILMNYLVCSVENLDFPINTISLEEKSKLKKKDHKINKQYKNKNKANCFLNYCLNNAKKGYCTSLNKSTEGIFSVETKNCRMPISNSDDIKKIKESCKDKYDGESNLTYSDRFGSSEDAPLCESSESSESSEFCDEFCGPGRPCTLPCHDNGCCELNGDRNDEDDDEEDDEDSTKAQCDSTYETVYKHWDKSEGSDKENRKPTRCSFRSERGDLNCEKCGCHWFIDSEYNGCCVKKLNCKGNKNNYCYKDKKLKCCNDKQFKKHEYKCP